MLHILWLILKIILKIIGILLGILLLLLLIVLLCPVRYEASAVKKADDKIKNTKVSARVTWLFRAVSATMEMENLKPEFKIRLFGISPDRFLKKKKSDKKKDRHTGGSSDKTSEPEDEFFDEGVTGENGKTETITEIEEFGFDSSVDSESASSDIVSETEGAIESPVNNEKSSDSENRNEEVKDSVEEIIASHVNNDESRGSENRDDEAKERAEDTIVSQVNDEESADPENGNEEAIDLENEDEETADEAEASSTGSDGRLSSFVSGIKSKYEKFLQLKDKAGWWLDFATDERTGFAIECVIRELKKIIRHILPRKIRGHASFGFEDPSITGRLLAAAGMTLPFHKNSIELDPRFEEKNLLDIDIDARGHILGIRFAASAVLILLNKDVWFVIKTLKKHKEE